MSPLSEDKNHLAQNGLEKDDTRASDVLSPPKFSTLDHIPKNLSAIGRAQEITRGAIDIGFKWENINQVILKVKEELEEVEESIGNHKEENIEEELGDLMLATTILCTYLGQDAEKALNSATQKFERRFDKVVQMLAAQKKTLQDATLEEMLDAWKKAKVCS